MAKFCTNCGREVNEGDNVCSNCGNVLNGAQHSNPTPVYANSTVTQSGSNGMAIAGFVVSLVSTILCCGAFNWLALVFSIIGLVNAKNYNNNGKGLAIAGIIISSIFMIIEIILVITGYAAAVIDEFA